MRSKRPSITGGRSRTPVLKREHSVTFSHTPLLPVLKKEESGFIRPPPAFIKCKNKKPNDPHEGYFRQGQSAHHNRHGCPQLPPCNGQVLLQ